MAERNISKITLNDVEYNIKDTTARESIPTNVSELNNDSTYVTAGATQSLTTSQKAQARTNIGAGTSSFSGSYNDLTNKPTIGNCSIITQQNVTVSSWASDTTYTDYPYRASVAISGCTTNHVPEVVFNLTEAISGNYAPICTTYNGGVYIYAKEQPATTITLATVECRLAN